MADPGTSVGETVEVLLSEAKRRVVLLATIFSVVSLGSLAFTLLAPKKYEAHTLILVDARNIITPLMEGRAVSTGASGQASILNQIMFSRRVLREVRAFAGWEHQEDPRAEESALTDLSKRIKVGNLRPEVVSLSYEDTDPARCYKVATKLAEIYVREGMGAKERESRDAFDFIDNQVKEYAQKLEEARTKLIEYGTQAAARTQAVARTQAGPRPKPAPGGSSASQGMSRPREVAPLSPVEIERLRAQEAALAAELERDSEVKQAMQRHQERMAQLQRELEKLRDAYTDEHPDVMRARQALQRTAAESLPMARGDEAVRETRAQLDDVRKRIAAAANTLEPSPAAQLAATPAEARTPDAAPRNAGPDATIRIVGQDTTLTELVRNYEAARDLYQDLLKRRENARVSMQLSTENSGVSLRILDPAELPQLPAAPRLMKMVAIGLVLAILAPFGFLFGSLQLDPRFRSAHQLESTELVPLLVRIPAASSSRSGAYRRFFAAAMVVGVFAIYTTAFIIRRIKSLP